eukprot:2928882-Pyramimonas_sp.AAC.1
MADQSHALALLRRVVAVALDVDALITAGLAARFPASASKPSANNCGENPNSPVVEWLDKGLMPVCYLKDGQLPARVGGAGDRELHVGRGLNGGGERQGGCADQSATRPRISLQGNGSPLEIPDARLVGCVAVVYP